MLHTYLGNVVKARGKFGGIFEYEDQKLKYYFVILLGLNMIKGVEAHSNVDKEAKQIFRKGRPVAYSIKYKNRSRVRTTCKWKHFSGCGGFWVGFSDNTSDRVFGKLKAVSGRDIKEHFFPTKNYKRTPLIWANSMLIAHLHCLW